jgi:antibiotic biosynthesis monooxygenase (ABM) superfamily enzyme
VAASTPTEVTKTSPVTIVTQTRVLAEHSTDFAQWQVHVDDVIAAAPGYLAGELIPPSPPVQLDWVIVQHFTTHDTARDWLNSSARADLLDQVQPWLVGNDDVHVFEEDETTRAPAPVSTVISTPVLPGNEDRYRAWQRRISAVQTRAPGFQGYKLQPPSPGISDDWVTILRFDSQANLDAWLSSPERLQLIEEAKSFTGESRTRTIKTGFDGWFPTGAASPVPWKQNMTVLLVLYPVVFLFGLLIGEPVFTDLLGMPFWLSLFVSNAASVVILSFIVPKVSKALGWWLAPTSPATRRTNGIGIALVTGLYAVSLLTFWLVEAVR